ncbi:MAG: nucleoside triphosphate pyrophosphohydrolase [Dongiaceae bacterium]
MKKQPRDHPDAKPSDTPDPVQDASAAPIDRLLAIMARLRDPARGCPWDLEQNFRTIVPHTIEEAYEVADAIERDDMAGLKDELGDLLFQVVFYAQMAREAGKFDFADIVNSLSNKMIRRHPHVFSNTPIDTADAQTLAWEEQKAAERAAATKAPGAPPSELDGVPVGLPALTRAAKLQKRAARIGFDWPAPAPVLDKIGEETAELRAEMEGAASPERLADELGDVLFACVNLARHLKLDPETALRGANAKFDRRFRRVEALIAARNAGGKLSIEALEALWQQAKREEPKGTP